MIRPGDVILFRHLEAADTVKVRPAVVLKVVGEHMLLVVGQTNEPRGAGVLVDVPGPARLQYSTYFDCQTVLAVPLERVEARRGQVRPPEFREIVRACGDRLSSAVQRASEGADLQRRRLAAAIDRHVELNECTLEEIADQARIARLHLRNVASGDAPWTRDEIVRIAQVLEVDAATLLEGEHPKFPRRLTPATSAARPCVGAAR
jgi:hypothetical protein